MAYTKDHLKYLIDLALQVAKIDGNFIELGVYKGDTLEPLCKIAYFQGKHCIGVDSFKGMSENEEEYLKGSHAANIEIAKKRCPFAILYQGWIPEILDSIQGPFSFVHIDLDQYTPTKAALEWAWSKLSPNGIMVGHDYFDKDILASKAYREVRLPDGLRYSWAWWKKC